MRVIIYIVILALTFLVPVERVDVANLLPIESVAVYIDGDVVVLETDTKDIGRGESVTEALQNLKDVTPAVVYLDTAEYLLISEDAASQVDGLREYLKPSVKVCICDAKGNVKEAAKHISIHGKTVPLREWKNNEEKTEKSKITA